MEPRIQYAKTSDGVNIAYWTLGEGPPVIYMWPFGSHLQLEWQMPAARDSYTQVAHLYTLVRYDPRGCGLSDREETDFFVEAFVRDLEAVTDRLNPGKLRVLAVGDAAPTAIVFAERHPERLSHLVLLHPIARGADGWPETVQGIIARAEKDWELASEVVVRHAFGWTSDEASSHMADTMREAVTPTTYVSFVRQMVEQDVTSTLPKIRVPTLVIQRRQFRYRDMGVARRIASAIPGGRLAVLEGSSIALESDGAAVVDEFFRAHEEAPGVAKDVLPSGMTAILFADIADSTALTERLGDVAFREKARELDTALRVVMRDHSGTPIEGKLLGDGVLAVFTSARHAIEAALACARAGDASGLPLHLGLHAGDVIHEEDNVYGGAVNIASRISGLSAAGEVLVSETVRSLARTSAGVAFEDRGEQALKGVGEKMRVWAVREGE